MTRFSSAARPARLAALGVGLSLGLLSPGHAGATEPRATPDPAVTEASPTEATTDPTDALDPAWSADEQFLGNGVADPRTRGYPRRHRFRLAFQMDHVRLSAAVNDEGVTQRFHYLPLQLDFGYQLQLLKFMMLRPSLALGANPANTAEAMPAVVHPQIFGGYSGRGVGAALGYGYLHPFPARKDVISDTRGGLGQPIITANHALRVELSYTTRIHSGALTFAARIGGVKSHIRHYDLNERGWRFSWGLQIGWYFGEGRKAKQRQLERQRERERNRRQRKR